MALFKQPTRKTVEVECKKVMFIQTRNTRIPEGFEIEKAEKDFNDRQAENIRLGFLEPDRLVKQFKGCLKKILRRILKRQKQGSKLSDNFL